MTIEQIVQTTNELKSEDLIWKPYYPNNMECNGCCGYYCTILHQTESGVYTGRKYSIIFQYKEDQNFLSTDEIELYILHENVIPK